MQPTENPRFITSLPAPGLGECEAAQHQCDNEERSAVRGKEGSQPHQKQDDVASKGLSGSGFDMRMLLESCLRFSWFCSPS